MDDIGGAPKEYLDYILCDQAELYSQPGEGPRSCSKPKWDLQEHISCSIEEETEILLESWMKIDREKCDRTHCST